MRLSFLLLLLLVVLAGGLAGCTSPQRVRQAEEEGYARGYRQAVKEQYWIIQQRQRNPPR